MLHLKSDYTSDFITIKNFDSENHSHTLGGLWRILWKRGKNCQSQRLKDIIRKPPRVN